MSIAGIGVIAFCVWSMIKTSLFLFLTEDTEVYRLFKIDEQVSLTLLYVVVGVMFLVDVAIRAYVGLSARAEARGKKKTPIYLVVAAFAAVANASSGILTAIGSGVVLSTFDLVITVVIEITATAALVSVIYCSVRLRRLRKASG